tara:strand:+ start:24538 stop:25254 length:717 start_codon:yes stop_codon:yes gene_type:complete
VAFVHGKDVVIYVNASNYSTYFNNADSTQTADIAETTTFGNSNKTYVPGEKDGTISLGGLFDATSDGVLQPLLGGADFNLVIGLDGVATGDRNTFGKGNISNYAVSSPVGDVVATSIDVQPDNGLFSGVVITNSAFTTTGAQGSAVDNTSSTTAGAGAFLIVTSVSGTSPTGDVKIQHSADNVTYADLITFTQATGATSEIKYVDKGTTINRYVRVHNTIGGSSTPTINAIVGFGRNN